MAANPIFLGAPKLGLTRIVNADGTNQKDLVTAGASGAKIVGLSCATNESASRTVLLRLERAAVGHLLGAFVIPITAGVNGLVPSVDLFDPAFLPGLPIDQDGQRYLFLESGDKLRVALNTGAVTVGLFIDFAAVYGDF